MKIKFVPPSAPTTSNPQTLPTYHIRTMAGDLEALKKGEKPNHIPITIEPPPIPTSPTQPANIKPVPAPEKIKPSFPKIILPDPNSIKRPPEPSSIGRPPLNKDWPPASQPKLPPFNAPIGPPVMPPQKQSQSFSQAGPPLDLPTDRPPFRPAPPPAPRPLTPPPIPTTVPSAPPRTMPPLNQTRPPLPPMPPQPTSPRVTPPAALPSLPQLPKSTPNLPRAESGSKKKLVLMATLGALILTFVVGEIWWFFLREKPSTEMTQELLPPPQELQPLLPPAVETPLATEPEKPSGLLNYDRTQILDPGSLTSLSSNIINQDELVKIEIAATDPAAALPTTLADVTSSLKIKIPTSVSKELTEEFDIFGFGGNTFDQSECARVKNNSPQCWGPRLGLAMRIGDPAKISSALRFWEKTMSADIRTLILAKTGSAATPAFQTGSYQSQTIRYKNLPINTITVEYALIDDILIITTSKSAMLKAIDQLPAPAESNLPNEIE